MKPVSLIIENFYCFEKAEIDFSKFNSACVVGRATDTVERSNGVGKSKIFAAIQYVLFNECALKNIENIIRDGAETCRVTFVFETDNETWKVVRSRGRKSNSADLLLFQKTGDDWKDCTQRTNSAVEKDLFKIIKMNHKTFENSALFSQGNLDGLPKLTPEKRKLVLKDVLQLNIYSKLEAVAKKKASDICKEIDNATAILSTFDGIEEDAAAFATELPVLEDKLNTIKTAIQAYKDKISLHHEDLSKLNLSASTFKSTVDSIDKEISNINAQVQSASAKKDSASKKLKTIKTDIETKIEEIKNSELDLVALNNKPQLSKDDVNLLISKIRDQVVAAQSSILHAKERIKELELPLPEGITCKHCRSALTEQHKEKCREDISAELLEKKKSLQDSAKLIQDLSEGIRKHESTIKSIDAHHHLVTTLNGDIANKKKIIHDTKIFFDNYKSDLQLAKLELEQKTTELAAAQERRNQLDTTGYEQLMLQAADVKQKIIALQRDLNVVENEASTIVSRQSVLADRLRACTENQAKKIKITEAVKQHLITSAKYQKLSQAFGSKGIPALIIHNMLDDLQSEANVFAALIKPGLQLKFDIDKEDSKGNKSDTLEISYFLHNREREFEQLSGAQKLVIMLSLRLALSSVIQKSFGINLHFLLLDEIDAALDKESLNLLFDAIKILEKDFKILLITHNDSLKEKFSHAILVEQNQDLVSSAKIVSAW